MAKINSTQYEVSAETAAALASMGLMCCMVVTLVGIKIWWFKHRLSFDQSSTSNGAVGGAQPQIVSRTRSSKDKRLTQQIREPVLVHGVFRKRQEDEIETIERPKLLPPIRERKLSQSTPELFRQSKQFALKSVSESEFLDIPAPPKREPPPPPVRHAPKPLIQKTSDPIPRSLTPPIFEKIKATPITTSTTELSEQFEEKTIEVHSSPIPRSPTPPIFEEIDTSSIMKSTTFNGERVVKAMEYYSSDEEDERREDEFIRAEKSKVMDEESVKRAPKPIQRNRSHNLEAVERRFVRARQTSFEKTKPRVNLMERRATGLQRPDALEWQQFHDDDIDNDSLSGHGREKGKLRKWEDLESYSEEIFKIEQEHSDKQEFRNKNVVFQVFDDVDGVDSEYEEKQEHKSTWTLKRRATGYPNEAPKMLTDLDSEGEETNNQQERLNFDESNKIWLEMERDLDKDFASNIEEEFNKIRHSYEANEEGFLEETANELDTGYGKSIEEDWENFEKLHQCDNKIASAGTKKNSEIKNTNFIETDEWLMEPMQQQKVHFNLNEDQKEFDHDGEEKESSIQIRERRPTGFERNSLEIQTAMLQEEEIEQNRVTTGRSHKVSFQLSDEQEFEDESEERETSLIKQHRPTGYSARDDYTKLHLGKDDDADEAELVSLEPDGPIKPKPRRQKVTFNFTAQVREHEIDDEDDDDDSLEDEDPNSSKQPTPMQRMSKSQDIKSFTAPVRAENTAALLFSTQVSAEYAASADEGFSDSWSAIRLHRQLTDEFQQLTLQEEEDRVPAKAVFRNPLAQLDADNRRDEHIIVAKPRTMRDMKKAQVRQTMHYDGSATEA